MNPYAFCENSKRKPFCQKLRASRTVLFALLCGVALSLASPLGGGGLPLARTERASCQRPPRMGCVEALAGCPLSHGCRRASVSAAASVGRWATSHRDVAAPKGEPSWYTTRSLQKAKSRLPLWGRCPRRGRRGQPASGAHVRWPLDEHERSELPWARIDSGGTPPFGKGASLFP